MISDIITSLIGGAAGAAATMALVKFLKGKRPPAPKSAWDAIDRKIDAELERRKNDDPGVSN